ncbi:MAG: DUF4231 domain-containing protein [Cytophagales bacterium]|nr:MAG: DUF4231 domain-containing protein [Cytophagales bacterium]TAF59722.1 MAG: DUF4231 domain-containing protein [Cytophagales bacterium]
MDNPEKINNQLNDMGKSLTMDAATYIKERLEGQMKWFSNKSRECQTKYKSLRNIEFWISASVPVAVSLSTMAAMNVTVFMAGTVAVSFGHILQVVSAIGGVFLVVISKQIELHEYLRYWKEYRATAEMLVQERFCFYTRVSPYNISDSEAFSLLVQRTETILSDEKQRWRQMTNEQQGNNANKNNQNAAGSNNPSELLNEPL